ncbi:hypothetical protein FRC00_013866 [Tulasnella sp. 408]|nr:hypothetical protein FRC00_013866 [Tulasnella sp. 408]
MLEINPNYSYVQVKEVLVPTGPWPNNLNETERKLAEIMQANLLRLLAAWKASILHSKLFPEEFVDQLAEVRRFVSTFQFLLTRQDRLECYERDPRATSSSSQI